MSAEGLIVANVQAALLLLAWVWHGGNDRLIYWLGFAFVASAWLGAILQDIDMHVALAVLDAVIVFAASRAWISGFDMRGWWVGLIGLAKIGVRLSYVTAGPPNSSSVIFWAFAAFINVAFAAQVIIAGGIADELGGRFADYLRRAGPRRARLLRNVAGR